MSKELMLSVSIKDCEVQTFRVGGHGGQKVNKTSSGVRVIHAPSGARAESRDTRSQYANKRSAFIKMTETVAFKIWMNRQLMTGPTAEQRVEQDMAPENLLVEVRDSGMWAPISEDARPE